MPATYHRKHFGTSKLYVGIDKAGKQAGSVLAYNQKEALRQLRAKATAIRSCKHRDWCSRCQQEATAVNLLSELIDALA